MSARHTRTGYMANDLHNGTCYVPSMGWVGSVMPPGRHRQAEHDDGCMMWHPQGGDYDRDCPGCMSMLIIDRLLAR